MTRYDRPDEPFYLGEVIGSYYSYHKPTCHIVRQIETRNYKRLRDHREAQALRLKPCPHCRPAFDPSFVQSPVPDDTGLPEDTVANTEPSALTASDLGDRRRTLLRLLDQVDAGASRPLVEGVAARINRLTLQDSIPREVAACMRVVTEMRNATEYRNKSLSNTDTGAVEASWAVVCEWATDTGLNL